MTAHTTPETTFTVKTFNQDRPVLDRFNFYVLNKGNNSGRPSYGPNPNCFVVSCQTRTQRDMLFWACKAMHLNGVFKRHLIGSVIPFIRIKEFTRLLVMAQTRSLQSEVETMKAVAKFTKLEKTAAHHTKTLDLIAQLQNALLSEVYIK